MDSNQFREFGKAAVDFIADYLENIRDRDVLPSVKPGEIYDILPTEIPENSEDWKTILSDVNNIIMPGMTHWQSPNFHAYFPTATSYPSIVGEMLSAGFGVVGFSWICSPACTELEVVVMDWIAKLLNLPEHFLSSSPGPGGGVIQGSASEAVLVAVLSAREKTVKRILQEQPSLSESEIRGRLVAYSSDQSNSCIEKAGLLAAVPVNLLPAGDDFALHGDALQKVINEDIAMGKIPIICIATLGTTGTCAFDNLSELGPICKKNNIWLHVDGAYAGAALALPEFQHLSRGLDQVDSFNFNLHKFMMVNFDCCAMWLKNGCDVVNSFNVDRIYLKHDFEGESKAPDYRHWQIPLGRRFRALKVWVTLRTMGADKIRENVRNHVALAKRFEDYLLKDPRFEIVVKQTLGLVCFRLKGDNQFTKALLDLVTDRKKIYIIQAAHKGKNFLRFVVCGMDPKEKDVDYAWNEIKEQTDILFKTSYKTGNLLNGKIEDFEKITTKFSNSLAVTVGIEKSK